ncbi:MAG: Mur ligase family protein, partial [Clostridiales bacterium]|nr:Mur ligase family protein [Clostridiales bacterium]
MPKAFTALRRYAALKSIPLLHQTAQLLGRLGTAMPGEVALKIYPSLLADLCQGQAVTLVTGTNGKSSVSALLAQMLRESGLSVIHNAGGANMASGLVTALGLQSKDLAQDQAKLVFEIDEAWFA